MTWFDELVDIRKAEIRRDRAELEQIRNKIANESMFCNLSVIATIVAVCYFAF